MGFGAACSNLVMTVCCKIGEGFGSVLETIDACVLFKEGFLCLGIVLFK